jgi:outer membrane biogenesis lipoprotein LolB
MRNTSLVVVSAICSLLLVACGEKPQDISSGKKADVPGWQGAQSSHADPAWKPGDRKAWEDHLRVRTQQGQNEYTRGGGKS